MDKDSTIKGSLSSIAIVAMGASVPLLDKNVWAGVALIGLSILAVFGREWFKIRG